MVNNKGKVLLMRVCEINRGRCVICPLSEMGEVCFYPGYRIKKIIREYNKGKEDELMKFSNNSKWFNITVIVCLSMVMSLFWVFFVSRIVK